MIVRRFPVLVCMVGVTLSALEPTPLSGQAGAAVAVTPAGEVLVLRPAAGRGEAAILVFERDARGGWYRNESLGPGAAAEPYEGFGESLAATDGLIVAAAADDDLAWAARTYRQTPRGWAAGAPIPVEDEPPPVVETRPAALDMAGLMRIMQPPPRAVALSGDGGTLALWAAGSTSGRVSVLAPRSDGRWRHEGSLSVRDSARGIPIVVLAADRDRVAVGDPRRGRRGVVRVFARATDGTWHLESELVPDAGLATFGGALALRGDLLAVGAPAAGRVLVYRRDDGRWTFESTVRPETTDAAAARTGFGAAVAWNEDGLWIGEPGADTMAGAVHRYVRDPATGTWRGAERFTGDGGGTVGPVAFGASLAASSELVVAGAPASDRSAGGAAVIERREGAWRGPTWLETNVRLAGVTGREVRCQQGQAAGFECGNVDLLAYLTLEDLDAGPMERVTDLWGWADPETGREYALVGRSAGMAIVDVTRPTAPTLIALVPGTTAGLRDIKVFDDHAFFVGDGAPGHGLVVFDLRRIRSLTGDEPVVLEPDARYDGFGSAHNLIMDAETGLAIPVGASGGGETCGGGLHMVDVSTPTQPRFAGCYTDTSGLIAPGRSHDGQCVIYRGPDRDYRERRVCFASNETALRIVDVTEPASPVEVARSSYPGVAYTHQGWLTEDHRYFFMNDELDELIGTTDRTRTLIWDVADLDDPILVGEHLGPDVATDHNLYIRGDRMYQANYQAGMRVVDISDPENPRDVGFFDTTPYGANSAGFGGGAWTAYPFLPSGTVLVSSMYEGLFLLRPRPEPIP